MTTKQAVLPGLPDAIYREIRLIATEKLVSRVKELLEMGVTGPWTHCDKSQSGNDWLVAHFGADHDGNEWLLTTDRVRASEYNGDARADAEFCAIARVLLPRLIEERER